MTDNLQERFKIARWMAARLAGTLEGEESEALDRWLAASPLHLQEWEELREAVAREGIEWLNRWQVNQAWSSFERKMPRRRRPLLKWGRYAAAVLLPLVAGVYTWSLLREEPARPALPLEPLQDVMPGTAHARLILNDGSLVVLAPEKDTLIREQNGLAITTIKHTITYSAGSETGEEAAGLYNTLIAPYGAEFSLQLADSTRVWLNAGSRLRYPLQFTGGTREVELEGEGYFEVASAKGRGFVVKTNGVEISVIGTSFNVSAYDGRVVTTLLEGKVSLAKGNVALMMLHPNQQAVMEKDGERFTVYPVVARNYSLWKDGIFWFEDVELGTILEHVARWYDVTLVYRDPEVKKLRYSMEMKRYEHIQAVLEKLEQTRKVTFTLSGQTIYITR
jgi:ferric-dicitrate binding protein FerR (iron transport regulator)